MKKKTHEKANAELLLLGMELLEEYKGRDYKHKIKCTCGEISYMFFGNAVKGKGGCAKCFRTKIVFTEERKENISKALKGKLVGELNPNFGNKMSDESKIKISIANFKCGIPKCEDCGKQLVKYTATKCKSCATKGENNPRYIVDRASLKDGTRVGGTNFWRASVLSVQDRCIICGTTELLHVHHLQSYRDFPELRLDIINGVTLCSKHHREFHSTYGNKEFTRDDFVDFYINKIEELEDVLWWNKPIRHNRP